MPGADSRGPKEPWSCSLAPPNKYDSMLCVSAARRAVATIQVVLWLRNTAKWFRNYAKYIYTGGYVGDPLAADVAMWTPWWRKDGRQARWYRAVFLRCNRPRLWLITTMASCPRDAKLPYGFAIIRLEVNAAIGIAPVSELPGQVGASVLRQALFTCRLTICSTASCQTAIFLSPKVWKVKSKLLKTFKMI